MRGHLIFLCDLQSSAREVINSFEILSKDNIYQGKSIRRNPELIS